MPHGRTRPRSRATVWADEQIREQLIFPAGRIVVANRQAHRAKPKRADYVLYYQRDYPLAVVEAKANYHQPSDGMRASLRRRSTPCHSQHHQRQNAQGPPST